MVEILSYKGKWNELGKELERVIVENNSKPKGMKTKMKDLFEDFAKEHDTTPMSAQAYYYNEIKPKLKEPMNIDESINNFVNSVTTELRDPRGFYKIGEVLEIEITSIHDFGVFGKTKEGFDGLIHVSEITGKQYVDLPDDYFYIGEKVRVKVKRLDNEGKMSFSTRALGGKEKINPAFRDITNTTMQETEVKTVAPKVEKIESVKIEEPKVEELNMETPKIVSNPVRSNDRDNIINFIKRYSDNNVSQKALADIDEMVAQFGVFQTTLSLMEAIRDLDISSFITELTKEKLSGDCLWRS